MINKKLEQGNKRNANLPRLHIYDFEDNKFVKREAKDDFICLAPQKDDEWERNFKKFFDPDGKTIRGDRSNYLNYHNPLSRFFVSGWLDNVTKFRAEQICDSKIIYNDENNKNDEQAWKGANVHSYDDADLGEVNFIGTQQKNYNTNNFMQSLALYKPYLCNDEDLSTIISAALRFYKEGWKMDNSSRNMLRPCNDSIDKDNKDRYTNLKYVAHLLAFAIEARRLPNEPGGKLKGYDKID